MGLALTDSNHSRLAQRLRRRYVQELALLPAGTPTREAQSLLLSSLLAHTNCSWKRARRPPGVNGCA